MEEIGHTASPLTAKTGCAIFDRVEETPVCPYKMTKLYIEFLSLTFM